MRRLPTIPALLVALFAGAITTIALALASAVRSQLTEPGVEQAGVVIKGNSVITLYREHWWGASRYHMRKEPPYQGNLILPDGESETPEALYLLRESEQQSAYGTSSNGRITQPAVLSLFRQFNGESSPDLSFVCLSGWPMECLRMDAEGFFRSAPLGLDGYHWKALKGKPWFASTGIYIPTTPLWPGLLINTLTWATLSWLALATLTALRRKLRTRRGLCSRCAYNRLGDYSTPCPECGASREP